MRRSSLFQQLTWSAYPFKYIIHVRDSLDSFYGDGVLETIVVGVSQPSLPKMMIVLVLIKDNTSIFCLMYLVDRNFQMTCSLP